VYTVFLAGGIASGKSTVARLIEGHGAMRIDLDQVSRDVCRPGGDIEGDLVEAFGDDLVDPETGELDRALLAARAFVSDDSRRLLEGIEMPAIKAELTRQLTDVPCCATRPDVCVVEIPLLDRVIDLIPLADEVMAVTCPLRARRVRAQGRGMDAADFDRRVSAQPSDAYLCEHADTIIDNTGTESALVLAVDAWWRSRAKGGWKSVPGGMLS
jgi:dephospho-CoA kinase